MPAIINDKNRDIYEQRLLEAGFELIRQGGLKALRVEDIARRAGFAKSTFYTFFSSKEEFIYKIALYERQKILDFMQQLLEQKGKMNKDTAKQFFSVSFLSEYNIYPYLKKEEYDYLKARCPELYRLNPESDEKNTKWLLSQMDTKKVCDWKLFSNYIKAIVTVTMNTENLYKDIYRETMELMIEGLLSYVFGDD